MSLELMAYRQALASRAEGLARQEADELHRPPGSGLGMRMQGKRQRRGGPVVPRRVVGAGGKGQRPYPHELPPGHKHFLAWSVPGGV